MRWYEILALIIGAMGGFEFIKWLWNQFFNRKNNARMAEADADSSEFHVLREQIQFLQEQLKEKEVRFAEQTDLVRKQNAEIFDLTSKLAETEIKFAKDMAEMEIQMVKVKCVDEHCPFRLPPNAFTPPRHDQSIEEYAAERETRIEITESKE